MSTAQGSTVSLKSGRGVNVALWVLQVLLAAAFLMAGASKLAGAEMMVKQFEVLGLGQWFRYLTGALEVVAAVLLLVPRWSGLGALLLIPTMLGAAIAHLVVFKNSPAAPLVFLALAAVVAWCRLMRDPVAAKASR
jgi:putative oxidoreductase